MRGKGNIVFQIVLIWQQLQFIAILLDIQ